MKLLILSRYDRLGASSRVRFFQYIDMFAKFGVQCEIQPLLSDAYLHALYKGKKISLGYLAYRYFIRFIALFRVSKFDVIWIEKELFPNLPAWFEQYLHWKGIRYVVDFDDAIFHNYDLSTSKLKRMLSDKIERVMHFSTVVSSGNSYISQRAKLAQAPQIEIIPTVIDLDRYQMIAPLDNKKGIVGEVKPVVIGWMGSPSTVKYLSVIAPALKILASEFNFVLRVIGAKFEYEGLKIDCRTWTEETEVEQIQGIDIGVMPLEDSLWERGKCGYKLIQYMACGKPVVASPVGVNQEIISINVNGYLANTPQEWLQALRSLLSDEQLRLMFGAAGRELVEQKYCIQVTGPKLVEIFKSAVNK